RGGPAAVVRGDLAGRLGPVPRRPPDRVRRPGGERDRAAVPEQAAPLARPEGAGAGPEQADRQAERGEGPVGRQGHRRGPQPARPVRPGRGGPAAAGRPTTPTAPRRRGSQREIQVGFTTEPQRAQGKAEYRDDRISRSGPARFWLSL